VQPQGARVVEPAVHGSVDADSVLTGRVVVEEGAVIERSTVRGPAIIGRDTVVRDTYVGPFTSIYFGCTLEDTEIEHSIVLEESTIRGRRPYRGQPDRQAGRGGASSALPRAHRLMLGDHSRVSIA
jgi:glucose-1-phosphate thymidylyltransferase